MVPTCKAPAATQLSQNFHPFVGIQGYEEVAGLQVLTGPSQGIPQELTQVCVGGLAKWAGPQLEKGIVSRLPGTGLSLKQLTALLEQNDPYGSRIGVPDCIERGNGHLW